ncbi:hypothetical protein Bbelb_108820 [Branchiostoma belcheri]|nr:hypothetical protein Bbelb_108820 [Branchiostoma belcheri]
MQLLSVERLLLLPSPSRLRNSGRKAKPNRLKAAHERIVIDKKVFPTGLTISPEFMASSPQEKPAMRPFPVTCDLQCYTRKLVTWRDRKSPASDANGNNDL